MAKFTADGPVRVRLRRPADLAAAVPHLVGFHPTESLVAVSLRGPGLRIGMTMRFDLVPAEHDHAFARHIVQRLLHDGAEQAFVACVTDEPGQPPELPRRQLVEAIDEALVREDLGLKEALLIRGGLFWSYLCHQEACCPATGTPVRADDAVDIAAAHALSGRSVLPDRAALVASIAPVTSGARRAMAEALHRADAVFADRVARGEADVMKIETVALFQTLAERYADPSTAAMTDDEAARIIIGLHDVPARDGLFPHLLAGDSGVLLQLLTDLCRRALPPDAAPVCTVLGWVAYAEGSGALASVAFERALASDPTYSFALILRDGLHGQVPPSEVRRAALESLTQAPTPQAGRRKRQAS